MPITGNNNYGCIPYANVNNFVMPRANAVPFNNCPCGAASTYCSNPPQPTPPPHPPFPPIMPFPGLEGQMTPRDIGATAWTYDPMFVEFQLSQSGYVYLSKIFIHKPTTVTSIMFVATAEGALVPGQNLAGIYNATGQLIAMSGDQTANWQNQSGYISAPIAPTQLAPGPYFAAFLFNSAGGYVSALGREICTIQGVIQGFDSRALQTELNTYTTLPAQFALSDFTADPTCHYIWAALA